MQGGSCETKRLVTQFRTVGQAEEPVAESEVGASRIFLSNLDAPHSEQEARVFIGLLVRAIPGVGERLLGTGNLCDEAELFLALQKISEDSSLQRRRETFGLQMFQSFLKNWLFRAAGCFFAHSIQPNERLIIGEANDVKQLWFFLIAHGNYLLSVVSSVQNRGRHFICKKRKRKCVCEQNVWQ